MTGHDFTLAGAALVAMGTGALYWPKRALLCVSDMHLGKSERHARLHAAALPPYETQDTLTRLAADLHATRATTVICLGDSFDDRAAAHALPEDDRLRIAALQAGRRWVWIEGNHDPGPLGMGGAHMAQLSLPPLVFRHVAQPGATAEVSGHYHPKARIRARGQRISRPAFLIDRDRAILPAFGTYTGGLYSHDDALRALMLPEALAVLTGPAPRAIPMPREGQGSACKPAPPSRPGT